MTETDDGRQQATSQDDGGDGGARRPILPPPAFPPGSRRYRSRRAARASSEGGAEAPDSPEDTPRPSASVGEAMVAPDEPLPEQDPGFGDADGAFISPDEPLPPRNEAAAGVLPEMAHDSQGVATGMGSDAHQSPEELRAQGDPHVMDLVERVGKLAQALRQRGEAGLRTEPDMDRFDATLRAYCVGYLAGRRAEEE